MAKTAFNVKFGAVLNQAQFQGELQKLMTTVKSVKPLELKSTFVGTGVDTANAEKALASLQSQGAVIGDAKVKMVEYQNTAGVVFRDIISMSGKVRDSLGNIGTSTVTVKSELADFVGTQDEFKKMADNANEWAKRAENMGQKEKQSIQGSTSALLAKIDAMNKLAQAGDFAGANKLAAELRLENATLKENIALTKEAAIQKQSWSQRMAAAIKQTIAYTFSIGLMRTAQQELNKAIKFTIDLNTEMTKIQVLQAEGAQTPEEINALAQSFNNLAIEMGTTTKAIAEGSVEWLRQGKTVQETSELLRASTMLSKLGALSAGEATEYLTSTLNSYGMAAEEAVSIVDKLVQVDNISATSTKELATALRYSAATAKQAGVELEELISYIAVVSSTTRQNAESIGQGMKTMFTRMQDIKAGAIDEDGLGLNNVESALARVNIQLRDTPTSFRDMSAVLEDVAAKWSTLNEIEQANIAKAIAGIRQQNLFQVLMQNMSKAIEYQTEQYNASGVALDRYGIYLESIEAKQQKVKAGLEALYMDTNFQDTIKVFLDLAAGILKVVDAIGGLNSILGILVGILIITKAQTIANIVQKARITLLIYGEAVANRILTETQKAQLITAAMVTGMTYEQAKAYVAQTIATIGAATAGKGLNGVLTLLSTNPITIWIVAIGALIAGLVIAFQAASKAAEKAAEEIKKLGEEIKTLSSNLDKIKSLKKEFDELTGAEKLNVEQAKRLVEVQNELKDVLPSLQGHYDTLGNFIVEDTRNMEELTASTLAQIEADKLRLAANAEKNAQATGKNLGKAYLKMERKEEKASKEDATAEQIAQAAEAKAAYERLLEEAVPLFKSMGEQARGMFWAGLFGTGAVREFDTKSFWNKMFGIKDTGEIAEEIPVPVISVPTDTSTLYGELVPNILEGYTALEEAKKKVADRELITQEEIEKLKEYGIIVRTGADGTQHIDDVSKNYFETQVDLLIENGKLHPSLRQITIDYLEKKDAEEKANQAMQEEIELANALADEMDVLSNATKEQTENGYISNQTAIELINTNAELKGYLTETANGFIFDSEAAYNDTQQKLVSMLTNWNLKDAALAAANGNLTLAASHIAAAEMADEQRVSVENLISRMNALATSVKMPSIGGGGGAGEDPAKKAIEERIKGLEKEKKALQERIKDFKEYIDLQKESLKRAKEEADFNQEQQKKAKDLAKIKNRILILSLDNSEEARAERIKLEEEAAELEQEITEDNEERKFDLQMQALEDLQKAFEDSINKQIEAIDRLIENLRESIEELTKSASGTTTGFPKIKTEIELAREALEAYGIDTKNMSDATVMYLQRQIEMWAKLGLTSSGIGIKLVELAKLLSNFYATGSLEDANKVAAFIAGMRGQDKPPEAKHQGGLIESHHDGEFAGNLMSNEVFAKLLKGEYVATEGQMDNFMKNILPRIIEYPSGKASDKLEQIKNEIQLTINVQGSLDRSVVPDIKEAMFEALNEALRQKGKKRNAFNYSV